MFTSRFPRPFPSVPCDQRSLAASLELTSTFGRHQTPPVALAGPMEGVWLRLEKPGVGGRVGDGTGHRKPLFKNRPGEGEQFGENRAMSSWVTRRERRAHCCRMDLPGKGAVGRASWG